MRMIDLFSGIGGFHYAAEQIWENVECLVHCEIDPFCQKVLKKHWPDTTIIADIFNLDGTKYANVDLLTGGFPCQPYSVAGQRKGAADDRALWPQMYRIIKEAKPRWVIAENVSGFLSLNEGLEFENCLSSLEDAGYEVQAFVIPACAVDAPHRRDRVWIVAHAKQSNGGNYSARTGRRGSPTKQKTLSQINRKAHTGNAEQVCNPLADTAKQGLQERERQAREINAKTSVRFVQKNQSTDVLANAPNTRAESMRERQYASDENVPNTNRTGWQEQRKSEPAQQEYEAPECGDRRSVERGLGGMVDGISCWLDEPDIPRVTSGQPDRAARLKALGNAIVPQVAVQIMKAIQQAGNNF